MKSHSRYLATNEIRPHHESKVTRLPTRTKRILGPSKTIRHNSTVALGKHKRNIDSTCSINQNEFRLILERLETLESAIRIVMERID